MSCVSSFACRVAPCEWMTTSTMWRFFSTEKVTWVEVILSSNLQA